MHHRGQINVALVVRHKGGHAGIKRGIFAHDGVFTSNSFAVDFQHIAPHAQGQGTAICQNLNIPRLGPALPPIEICRDVATKGQRRRNRGLAVFRKRQRGPGQMHRGWQNFGQDRQGVDAGIKHAHAASLEHPILAGVPFADILAPCDMGAGHAAVRQPCLRPRHTVRHAAVPCGEQGYAIGFGQGVQRMNLGQCLTGGFFQHHMAASAQRRLGIGKARLRRQTQRHDRNIGPRLKHRGNIGERLHAVHRA